MKRRLITYQSRTQNVAAWARELGISRERLRQRLAKGSVEYALNPGGPFKPNPRQRRAKSNQRLVTHKGKTQSVKAWAHELNLRLPTLYYRLRKHDIELAMTPRKPRGPANARGPLLSSKATLPENEWWLGDIVRRFKVSRAMICYHISTGRLSARQVGGRWGRWIVQADEATLLDLIANRRPPPTLSERLILFWAHVHFQATGQYPDRTSGPVAQSPQETWLEIHHALRRGFRGLPGGISLAELLAKHGLGS